MNPPGKCWFNCNDVVILHSSSEKIIPSGYYILEHFSNEVSVKRHPFSSVTGNYIGLLPTLGGSYIKKSKDEYVNNFIILLENIFSKKEIITKGL